MPSEYSPATRWSKPSIALGSRAATKDSKQAWRPSKWRSFRANFARPKRNRLRPPLLLRLTRGGASNVSLRSKSREFAMQMLFQWDMSQQDPTKLEAKFWKSAKAANKTREFANQLFEGTAKEAATLDEIISKHCENWRFERLAAIDRAILRLAIHEMSLSDTPPKVVLNEAVDLAKKFSSEESGAFVNGVLDAVHKSLTVK